MFSYTNWLAKHLFKIVLILSIFPPFITTFCFDSNIHNKHYVFPRTNEYDYDICFNVVGYEQLYSFDFLLIADIGGVEVTDESGKIIGHIPSKGQMKVAKKMMQLKNNNYYLFKENQFIPKFVLNLGDNFYDSGIGPEEAEERFYKTFLRAYEQLGLTFNSIPGNNDYKVPDKKNKTANEIFEIARGRVHAQINLTNNHSNLWFFPSEYYVLKYEMLNFNIVFIMIDTTLLCGGSRKESVALQKEDTLEYSKKSDRKLAQEKHFKWLEEVLSRDYSKEADYLFVAGHYPVYMAEGDRAFTCSSRLQNLFFEHKISAYFSGHEHSLKHIQVKHKGGTHFFDQIISGGGTKVENCLQQKHVYSQLKNYFKNFAPDFKICYPAGLNEEQINENYSLKNNDLTQKTNLEVNIENTENHVKKEKLKEKLKNLENKLDEASYEKGGFIAVQIDENSAKFKFLPVGGVMMDNHDFIEIEKRS